LPYLRKALAHLRRQDPKLAAIMARVGRCTLQPRPDPFVVLARSIVSQLISTKAAATIYGRIEEALHPRPVNPANVLELTTEQLRSAGLSRAKAAALHDLAAKASDGTVMLDKLDALEDAAIIAQLIQVKGIGRWTAEMFLIFGLGRPDVLPVDDLGLRVGVQRMDRLAEPPPPKVVRQRGAAWAPFRSIATWYLWQSLRLEPN
jgi:3-methyladenine DNA glycosylase/8-oxoguanine DNA glycosylase